MLSALALGGCVELLDLDRFKVASDAGTDASVRPDGGRDPDGGGGGGDPDGGGGGGDPDGGGGERDAGRDACVPVTYYLDRDGDGYGDPATALESCTPIEGRVTNGDDCNDDDDTIRPGATERCDDVDQDCDGAVDEGLMRPLGDPILITSNYSGWGSEAGATVVATRQGYAVIWRSERESTIQASFLAHDGSPFAENIVIARRNSSDDPDVTAPVATRFTVDGLDQIVIAWREPESVRIRLCTPRGDCSHSRPPIFEGSTENVSDMEMQQLGRRIVARVTERHGPTSVVSFNPQTATISPILSLHQPSDPGLRAQVTGLATVEEPEPYTLLARLTGPENINLISPGPGQQIVGEVHLIKIRGVENLSFDEADVLPWEFSERCGALGGQFCYPGTVAPKGAATTAQPWLSLLEVIAAADLDGDGNLVGLEPAGCIFGLEVNTDTSPNPTSCTPIGSPFVAEVTVRGSVATVLRDTGVTYAIQDAPLGASAHGSELVEVPLDVFIGGSGSRISMRDARGAVIGIDRNVGSSALSLLRIGCEP